MDKDSIIGSAKDIGGKLEGAVGDATGDATTQASGRAREAVGTAQENSETLRASSEAVAQKVQQNPLGSLLMAGCIGFALALLMTRPPRRAPPRLRDYR